MARRKRPAFEPGAGPIASDTVLDMITMSASGPSRPGRGPARAGPMTPARRALSYASLDEVMPDVDRLLRGHTTAGSWSLAQICRHLALSIHCTIDGFPARAPWIVRKTIGRLLLRRILRTGRFVEGMKAPAAYQPAPGPDVRAEAEC